MSSRDQARKYKSWSMFRSKHDEVDRLLEKDDLVFDFNPRDESDCEEDWDTNVMGRFRCPNQSCLSEGWASKKVAMTIRMYPGNRYNARVYHQRCKICNRICRPRLDDSYADRVSYRLKKWSGVAVTPPPYSERAGPPHRQDLCEGCQTGRCNVAEMYEDWIRRPRI